MIKLSSLILGVLLLAGCAGNNPADPYEKYNRKVYAFNTTLDEVLLKPVATGYRAVTPNLVRDGIGNAIDNLTEPRNMVNNLLQGRITAFLESTHRFVFNSTFGLGGLVDLTSTFKLPEYKASDFGMTLAYYGWEESSYFLLPFLPPRTFRDQVGLGVDVFITDPRVYVMDVKGEVIVAVVDNVNARSNLLEADKLSKKISLDNYVFQRESVLQHRNNQLRKSGIDVPDQSYNDEDDDEFSISDIARQNAQ
ncbi:MlaA family lipoprotein [Wohlfahrtiimonas populi]|uniref:MlaA family lipoprotein n=1 Tax=Wohlfahrtiimonas populi TaxID=1940240 RepID=UPI00098CF1E3|nr:VacJ family lipoprotein [Wohlfahrtiimonas populi]